MMEGDLPFFARSAEQDKGRHALSKQVLKHFETKGRVWPSVEDALLFMMTEVAEAIELILIRKKYVRNHPEHKEFFTPARFAEELSDVIYMAVIAGEVEGVDPLNELRERMKLSNE